MSGDVSVYRVLITCSFQPECDELSNYWVHKILAVHRRVKQKAVSDVADDTLPLSGEEQKKIRSFLYEDLATVPCLLMVVRNAKMGTAVLLAVSYTCR